IPSCSLPIPDDRHTARVAATRAPDHPVGTAGAPDHPVATAGAPDHSVAIAVRAPHHAVARVHGLDVPRARTVITGAAGAPDHVSRWGIGIPPARRDVSAAAVRGRTEHAEFDRLS